MNSIRLFVIGILPIFACALITQYDPFVANSSSFLYQSFYMLNSTNPKAQGSVGNGHSYMTLHFTVSKSNPTVRSNGIIEAFFASSDVFDRIGFAEGGRRILCCDEEMKRAGNCSNPNHLVVPAVSSGLVRTEVSAPQNGIVSLSLYYETPEEGKYFMILAMCDVLTSNLNVSGEVVTMNPHGHIPARLYGSIPFTKCLLAMYSFLLFVWSLQCLRYYRELLSVHKLIFFAIISFCISTLLHLASITAYNQRGVPTPSITTASLFATALTRTLSRGLMLTLAMGAGVTYASLGSSACHVLLACALYFLLALWDTFSSTLSPPTSVLHSLPAGIADSALCGWTLAALLRTVKLLEATKQTSKLRLFLRLRNVLCGAALVAAAFVACFSVFSFHASETLWKYQWFFDDGVWALFHFSVLCCVAWLWAPNEHSLAYAYHVQVATDERTESEVVPVQDGLIQGMEETGVLVNTIRGGVESLKPMKM